MAKDYKAPYTEQTEEIVLRNSLPQMDVEGPMQVLLATWLERALKQSYHTKQNRLEKFSFPPLM